MIIIKPSLEEKPTTYIAENSARAPFFLVFERNENGGDVYIRTVKNPFTWSGGAGIAAVDLLKDEGCDVFVAKKIGEKMKDALDQNSISYEVIQ